MHTFEQVQRAVNMKDINKYSVVEAATVYLGVKQLKRLDRIIAYCEEHDVHVVTRSSITRDALETLLDALEVEFPEVTEGVAGWLPE